MLPNFRNQTRYAFTLSDMSGKTRKTPLTPKNLRSKTMQVLRRQWLYHWKPRKDALKNQLTYRANYVCQSCSRVYHKSNTFVDHITPVVPDQGWDNWDGYMERLYCDKEGYQVLCKVCHTKKTADENRKRKLLSTNG